MEKIEKKNATETKLTTTTPEQPKAEPLKLKADQHIAWTNKGKNSPKVIYIVDQAVPISEVSHRLNRLEVTGGLYPCTFYELTITAAELKAVMDGKSLADKPAVAKAEAPAAVALPQTADEIKAMIGTLTERLQAATAANQAQK